VRKTIGRYRIEEKLGEGGMGEVYAAVDAELGRRVALKMIHEAQGDATARERMWREARAAAGINHPNVCQVHEVGEEDGELYLAMELLEGEALSDRLERGALALGETLAIVLEILAALDALHGRGFVHRDLKPSNVFLTPHGVKLLDFGLALPLESAVTDTSSRLTMTGMMVGTPAFMAPEQWRGEAVGPAADLFGVGALLFEMLAGEPAFKGTNPLDVYHSIVHEQTPALVGGASIAAVDRVLQRALAKTPEERYPSAAEMSAELEAAGHHADDAVAPRARTITRLLILPFQLLRPDEDMAFVCVGLPDAIATSLSALESLVVRSSHTAVGAADANPDIVALARDANVDKILLGTVLRAGDRLRVSVQLLEASSGEMTWSDTVDADVGDIFQLQDDLARHIVDSLSISLTTGDERGLQSTRPASPEAYEYYLRANQLSYNSGMLGTARDLYLACIERDPAFAPAWARLGRTYRVMAKYAHGDVTEDYRLAEEAFRKALELSPDLSIAHNLFTHYEIEQLAGAPAAMLRLLEQASRHPSDPELFSGLVVACRFCGLFEASIAADRRARRLDPSVRTSVAYTYWMQGDYEQAMGHDDEDMRYVVLYSLPHLGRADEALAIARELAGTRRNSIERNFVTCTRTALEGDREGCLATVKEVLDSRFDDPEGLFHLLRELAYAGEVELPLKMLQDIVRRGLHCPDTLERDPWLETLRAQPAFEAIVQEARAGHESARSAFLAAGGDRLLVL